MPVVPFRRRPSAGTDPRSFDHLPAVFDRFSELVGGPLHDWLADRLPVCGGRAVDLGCGSGHQAALFADRYVDVLGVDLSAPMLRLACEKRSRPNVRYEHRDLLDVTPDRDGRFDLVFSAYTLHHVPDLPAALRQIRSLVAPGGFAVLIDNVDHRRQVPASWFRAEARKALWADLTGRRRPVREAVEAYRLSTHPAWLGHLSTDVFLTPADFGRLYRAAFPGSELTPMYRATAVVWTDGLPSS